MKTNPYTIAKWIAIGCIVINAVMSIYYSFLSYVIALICGIWLGILTGWLVEKERQYKYQNQSHKGKWYVLTSGKYKGFVGKCVYFDYEHLLLENHVSNSITVVACSVDQLEPADREMRRDFKFRHAENDELDSLLKQANEL